MAVLFLTKEQFIAEFESKLSKKEIAGCQPGTTFTIDEDQICLLPLRIIAPKPVVVKEAKTVEKEKKSKKPESKKDTPKKAKVPRKNKAEPDPVENQWFTGLFGN